MKVGGGRIVSVQPKAAVMSPVAVTMTEAGGKDWRSGPGLAPPVFGDIAVEGVGDPVPLKVATG